MAGGVGVAGQTLGLHPCLHARDRPTVLLLQPPSGIAVAVHLLGQPLAEGLGGDDHAGPQQRLLLPGLGVPAEVVDPGLGGAGERADLPLGAQIGADLHVGAGDGGVEDLLDLGGDGVRDLDGVAAGASVHGDELHVRIGGVAHLPGAEAALGDDRQLHAERPRRIRASLAQLLRGGLVDLVDAVQRLGLLADHLPLAGHDVIGDQQPGLEHRLGEVGEGMGDLRGGGDVREMGERDPQQLTAAGSTQHVPRLLDGVHAGDHGEELPAQHVAGQGAQLLVAGQPAHRLRDPLELLADVPARGQHLRQPLGGETGVAQQPHVPVGGADLVGEAAEGEQSQVRVDPVGEPFEHRREQLALDPGAAGDPLGEGGDVRERPAGVAIADRGQARLGVLGAQRDLPVGQLRGGQQQRSVEDLLVQLADASPGALVALRELVGAEAQTAGEAAQVRGGGGQHLGAAQAVQLEAVLDAAQEAVGLVHLGDVGAGDVAALAEPGEGVEGGAALELLVGAAVHHLQQLDGELDVPQSAGAELDVAVHLGARDVGDDAAAHRPGVLDEALAGRGLPHPRLDHLLVGGAEVTVAGGGAGLQQRLELPGLRPFGVVAAVGVQGAHQRAVLALGAQVRVHLPQRALGGALGAGAGELPRQRGPDRDHVLLVAVLVRGGDDVHDVDVGDVVELPRAGLAHRDDGPAHLLVPLDGGTGDRGGRLEGGIGEVADRDGDAGLEGGGVGGDGVGRGDLGQAQVVGGAQRVALLAAAGARHGHLGRRIGADGLQQRLAHGGGRDRELVVPLAQELEPLGVAGEHVAERDRDAEQADQPVPRGAGGAHPGEELLEQGVLSGLPGGLRQAQQAEDGVVPVGRRAEGLRGPIAETSQRRFGEEAADAVGAAEAEAGEGAGGGRRLLARTGLLGRCGLGRRRSRCGRCFLLRGAVLLGRCRGVHGVPVRPG